MIRASWLRRKETSPDDDDGDARNSLWRRLLGFAFGYDFFISYSWSDGGGYASALTRQLRAEGYEVFFDRDDYASGDDWKKVGAWKLRRTGQLVLIGSPAALLSAPVLREIQVFSGTRRRIVPIDFDGTLEWKAGETPLAHLLPVEILRIREPASALQAGPSDQVVTTIRRTFNLVRQDKKRMRVLVSIAILLGILAITATWFAHVARVNEQAAEQRRKTSLSRQLAADAVSQVRDNRPDLGLLLGVEANLIDKTLEAKSSLIAGLNWTPALTTILPGTAGQDVRAIAFGPEGKTLAAVNATTIALWDVATRRPLDRSFPAQKEGLITVAFSPDGKRLATSSMNGSDAVTLWDIANGQPDGSPLVGGSSVAIQGIAFSPDNTVLASGGGDHKVTFWDLKSRKPLVEPPECQKEPSECHDSNVSSVAFAPDGKRLVSGSWDGTVRIWDVSTGRTILPAMGEPGHGQVETVAFSPNGRLIASSGGSKEIVLWDPEAHTRVRTLSGHAGTVTGLAFMDDRVLASSSEDGTVMIWDVANAKPQSTLRGHTQRVTSVSFDAGGTILASGGADGTIMLWDVGRSSRLGAPLPGRAAGVGALAFSPDGRALLSGGCGKERGGYKECEGEIHLWNLADPQVSDHVLSGHTGRVMSVAFAGDGKTMRTGSCAELHGSSCRGIEIRTWDVATLAEAAPTFVTPTPWWFSLDSLAFGPGDMLAAGSCQGGPGSCEPGEVRLLQIASASTSDEPLVGNSRSVLQLAFSANGRTLASASLDDVILWDVAGKRSALGLPFPGRVFAFRSDGAALAVFDQESRTIVLRDAATGRPIGQPFIGAPEIVLGMAFSPDGDTLVVNGTDLRNLDRSWIALWDVATRQQLSEPLSRQPETFRGLAFSRDGKALASSSESSTVTLWDMDPDSWRKRACVIANRNLSYAEWKQYLGDEQYRATCPGVPVDIKGLVLEGERLARSGDLTPATNVLRQARTLDPQLRIEPDVAVKRHWRESLIEQGEYFAKAGDVSRAVSLFQQAIDVDPEPPLEPRAKANVLAAPRRLQEGLRLARAGKIEEAAAAVAEVSKLNPSLEIDAQTWGELCQLGSLSARPKDVMDACDHAVTVEPENGSFHDSRGIVRARIGDRPGAIDDFEAFVAMSRHRLNMRIGYDLVERLRAQIPQREDWIRALRANEDPLTPNLVEELRRQYAEVAR